ncbi:hypothetical protein CR513_12425, partial [Mucuna pruriens]
MVNECIMLGHRVSQRGIKMDPTKVEVITKLPLLVSVRVKICQKLVQIAKPIINILAKEGI